MVGYLSGTVVRSETLEPLSDVEIQVRDARADKFISDKKAFKKTDVSGSFFFENLASGRWVVEYRLNDGTSGNLQANVVDNTMVVVDIEIDTLPMQKFPEELLQTFWRLVELNGQPFRGRATVVFSNEGRLEGEAPCNRFVATYRAQWPDLHFCGLSSTEVACDELEAEDMFFSALKQVDRAALPGVDGLALTGPGGVSLRFELLEKAVGRVSGRRRQVRNRGSSPNVPREEQGNLGEKGMMMEEERNLPDNAGKTYRQTGSVRGKVVEEKTERPVENATITVLKSAGTYPDIAPVTDADGRFSLDELPPGEWVFQALAPDGQMGEDSIKVAANSTRNFIIRIS